MKLRGDCNKKETAGPFGGTDRSSLEISILAGSKTASAGQSHLAFRTIHTVGTKPTTVGFTITLIPALKFSVSVSCAPTHTHTNCGKLTAN